MKCGFRREHRTRPFYKAGDDTASIRPLPAPECGFGLTLPPDAQIISRPRQLTG